MDGLLCDFYKDYDSCDLFDSCDSFDFCDSFRFYESFESLVFYESYESFADWLIDNNFSIFDFFVSCVSFSRI